MKRTITCIFALVTGLVASFAQGGFQFREPEKPSDPSYETKEITVQSRGMKLYGVATFPKNGKAKNPAVIMSHGYGGNGMGFYSQMDALSKEGYICYAIDFQGGGRVSKSEGKTTEMSIFTEKQNLLDVLEAVRGWEGVDTDNVFLLGESQGGCVSAITAPEVSDKIKAICLIFPALCIPDDGRALYKTVADIPQSVNVMGMEIGRAYYEPIHDYDVYPVIEKYQGPVLIVHGTDDQLVKVSYSERASKLYKDCEFHTIQGAGHGFWGESKATSDKYVADFLRRQLAR